MSLYVNLRGSRSRHSKFRDLFWRAGERDIPCEMIDNSLEKGREADSLYVCPRMSFFVESRAGRQTPFQFLGHLLVWKADRADQHPMRNLLSIFERKRKNTLHRCDQSPFW